MNITIHLSSTCYW